MKPTYEQLSQNVDHSFAVRKVIRPQRADLTSAGVWHFHPDYEITLTTASSGRRFVGYNYEDYSALDLVLIGSNMPHCWITEEPTVQYVINFKKDFIGSTFWQMPELTEINQLLDRSSRGIKFSKDAAAGALPLIEQLQRAAGFDRLMNFLELLRLLARDRTTSPLTNYDGRTQGNPKLSRRIEKVYSYVLENYKDPDISQAQLAEELNMTSSSLCKFVKYMTRKTLYQLILEARISHACRLLVNTDKYVSEIGYLSGFQNVSNFNRIFKRLIKQTPMMYRKSFS